MATNSRSAILHRKTGLGVTMAKLLLLVCINGHEQTTQRKELRRRGVFNPTASLVETINERALECGGRA